MKWHPLFETPLAQVARVLYDTVEATEDPVALWTLSSIPYDLQPVLDRELINGIGRELNIWVDLKRDAPEMGATYGDGIKTVYPEVFTSG